MVRGKLKSSRLKKVSTRTPGAKSVIHRVQRKVGKTTCASCKTPLHGLKTGTARQVKNSPLSAKRVSRKFGGHLCGNCTRRAIIDSTRIS